MSNFVNLNIKDYTKRISTDKFVLGNDYALILPPDTTIDSHIRYFSVFAFADENGASLKANDAKIFTNPISEDVQIICDQTYDVIHQEKFNIVYFRFMPITIFLKDPFAGFGECKKVANALYLNNVTDMGATHFVITDDIANAAIIIT